MSKPQCSRRRCDRPQFSRGYCRPCYYAMRKYGKLPTLLVDAAAARTRIELQVSRGRTWHDLADAIGSDPMTIGSVATGRSARLRRDIEQKILAAPIPCTQIGVVRRVRALARLGWPREVVVAEAGLPLKTLERAMKVTLRPRVSEALALVYEARSGTPGPSERLRKLAAAKGWAPPAAWDDIDDPNAVPDLGEPAPRGIDWAEVRHLADFRVPVEEIARRLGVRENTIRAHYPRRAA